MHRRQDDSEDWNSDEESSGSGSFSDDTLLNPFQLDFGLPSARKRQRLRFRFIDDPAISVMAVDHDRFDVISVTVKLTYAGERSEPFELVLDGHPFPYSKRVLSKASSTVASLVQEKVGSYDIKSKCTLEEFEPLNKFLLLQAMTVTTENLDLMTQISDELGITALLSICRQMSRSFETREMLVAAAGLQEVIMDEQATMNEMVESIMESFVLRDFSLLVRIIHQAVLYRPAKSKCLCGVVEILVGKLPSGFLDAVKEMFLLGMSRSSNYYFIYELMVSGVLEKEEVLEAVRESSVLLAMYWFAPELEETTPDIWDFILDMGVKGYTDIDDHNKFFAMMEEDHANDWAIHKQRRAVGHNSDVLATAIREDRCDDVQDALTVSEFGWSRRIPFSHFDRSSILSHGPTIVQYAAFYGSRKCFQYFVMNGCTMNHVDKVGVSLMEFAIAGGHADIVRICQEKIDGIGLEACMCATEWQMQSIGLWLQDAVLGDDRPKDWYDQIFERACMHFNFSTVHSVLSDSDLEAVDGYGCTVAIDNANVLCAQYLFPFYALSTKDALMTTHVFVKACSSGSLPIVKLVWERMNTRRYNMSVKQAIGGAFNHDSVDILQFLETIFPTDVRMIIAGSEEYRDNVMEQAVRKGSVRCVKYIVQHPAFDRAKLSSPDFPVLREAADNRQLEIIRFLLSYPETNVNASVAGGTAFTLATWTGQLAICKLLLAFGDVDVNRSGARNETPLTGCLVLNDHRILRMLLDLEDIDPNAVNKLEVCPLMSAVQAENMTGLCMLLEHPKCNFNVPGGMESLLLEAIKQEAIPCALKLISMECFNINRRVHGRHLIAIALKMACTAVYNALWERSDLVVGLRDVAVAAIKSGDNDFVKMILTSDRFREQLQRDINVISEKTTPLISAINSGDDDLIELIMSVEGVDPNLAGLDGMAPLMVAVRMGHTRAVCLLVERDDILVNMTDNDDRSALSVAAANGRDEMVAALLARPDIVHVRSLQGMTPAFEALENNHMEAFRMIIAHGKFNPNETGRHRRTLIATALARGLVEVFRMLIVLPGLDVNERDEHGDTPLSHAVRQDSWELMSGLLSYPGRRKIPISTGLLLQTNNATTLKALITMDVDLSSDFGIFKHLVSSNAIDATRIFLERVKEPVWYDYEGDHVLKSCIENGLRDMFNLLLGDPKINVNGKSRKGRTPLMIALKCEQVHEVKALLAHQNIDMNATDGMGKTALFFARGQCIPLMLAMPSVEVNHVSQLNVTVLERAVYANDEDAVVMFVEKGAVYRSSNRKYCCLTHAVVHEQKGIFDVLMQMQGVDINERDVEMVTPLQAAVSCMNEHMFDALMKCDNIDVNVDGARKPPLAIAVANDRIGMCIALLDRGAVVTERVLEAAIQRTNVQMIALLLRDIEHISAIPVYRLFSLAVRYDSPSIVDMLLGIPTIDVNSLCDNRMTMLMNAASNGRPDIVKRLLACPKIDVNAKSVNGETAFMFAVSGDSLEVVELFLTVPDLDMTLRKPNGVSALAENVNIDIIEKLAHVGVRGLNCFRSSGQSLLCRVCGCGRADLVKVLLQIGDIDINTIDSRGLSPLSTSIAAGYTDIANMLLSMPNVDINAGRAVALCESIKKQMRRVFVRILAHPDVDVNYSGIGEPHPLLLAANATDPFYFDHLCVHPSINLNVRDSMGRTAHELIANRRIP